MPAALLTVALVPLMRIMLVIFIMMMIVTLRRRKRVLANRTKTMLLLVIKATTTLTPTFFFLRNRPPAGFLSPHCYPLRQDRCWPLHITYSFDAQMVAFGFKFPGFRTMITGWGASERKMLILFLI